MNKVIFDQQESALLAGMVHTSNTIASFLKEKVQENQERRGLDAERALLVAQMLSELHQYLSENVRYREGEPYSGAFVWFLRGLVATSCDLKKTGLVGSNRSLYPRAVPAFNLESHVFSKEMKASIKKLLKLLDKLVDKPKKATPYMEDQGSRYYVKTDNISVPMQ
jgi:hypothetical protein